jgi:hypothetical protein
VTVNETPARDRLGQIQVTERFVVVTKPGNAGGAKGPQFRDSAGSGEGRKFIPLLFSVRQAVSQ